MQSENGRWSGWRSSGLGFWLLHPNCASWCPRARCSPSSGRRIEITEPVMEGSHHLTCLKQGWRAAVTLPGRPQSYGVRDRHWLSPSTPKGSLHCWWGPGGQACSHSLLFRAANSFAATLLCSVQKKKKTPQLSVILTAFLKLSVLGHVLKLNRFEQKPRRLVSYMDLQKAGCVVGIRVMPQPGCLLLVPAVEMESSFRFQWTLW